MLEIQLSPIASNPVEKVETSRSSPSFFIVPRLRGTAQAEPQSLQFSGFQGRALEPVTGDRREVPKKSSFSLYSLATVT